MEKKLYWKIQSNEDTNITFGDLESCKIIIEADIEGRPQDEVEQLEFTITPVYLTEEEYDNLPEWDGY